MRFFKGILLFFILFAFGWTLLLQFTWVQNLAINHVKDFVQQELHVTLEIKEFHLSFPLSLELQGVQILDGDEKLGSFETGTFKLTRLNRVKFCIEDIWVKETNISKLQGSLQLSEQTLRGQLQHENSTLDFTFSDGLGTFAMNYQTFGNLNGTFSLVEKDFTICCKIQGESRYGKLSGSLALDQAWQWKESFLALNQNGQKATAKLVGPLLNSEVELTGEGDEFTFFANGALSKDQVIADGKFAFRGWEKYPIPIHLSGEWKKEISLISHFDAAAFTPLLPGSVLAGNFEVELEFADDLLIKGKLSEGEFEHVSTGIRFDDLNFELEGNQEKIGVTKFIGTDPKKGIFSANGALFFNDGHFQINGDLKEFYLVHLEVGKGCFSGPFDLTGDLDEAVLHANLTLDDGRISIKETKRQSPLTVDVTFINEEEREEKKLLPTFDLVLDATINAPDTLEIKGRGLESIWGGTVLVKGSLQGPLFSGALRCKEGMFSLSGKELVVQEGEILFQGEIEKTAIVGITQVEVEGKKIELVIQGPVKDPKAHFRSNPAMNQREIVSYLLFNKGVSQISSEEKYQIAQTLTLLSSSGSKGTLSKVQKALGIDKIDISSTQEGQTKVQVGKRIGKDTLLSVSREFGGGGESSKTAGANHLGIETRLKGDIRLQVEVSDESTGQLNLIWKRDY
jgi:autotransporter translocation and assembly factor TamB